MSVTIHPENIPLSQDQVEAWQGVPASIVADLQPSSLIDPAIQVRTLIAGPLHLLGRARTVSVSPPDFGGVIHVLDHAKPGQVVVIAANGETEFAMIGEILGGHLRDLGCKGVVVDGAVRDIDTLGSWEDFPVFARSITPRGPTSANDGEINASVSFGGCKIALGDLILGDRDGLVVLSPVAARDLLSDVKDKIGKEAEWVAGLKAGKNAMDVFGL